MDFTKTELRIIARYACKSWYGFHPSMRDIVLTEVSTDARYIYFSVNGISYRFYSTCVVIDGASGSIDLGDYELQRLG